MFTAVCADLCCVLWSEIGLYVSAMLINRTVSSTFFVGFVTVKRVIFSCSVVAHVIALKLELIIQMYLPVCHVVG